MTEELQPDEQDSIDRVIRVSLRVAAGSDFRKRDQHPKHHGLVEGVLTVADEIPDRYRVGLFAGPRSYKALVRYSNGRQQDDRKRDAHGMAIKLLDVPGQKLLPGQEGSTTHDIICVDHPTFFTGDLKAYAFFSEQAVKFTGGWLSGLRGGLGLLFGDLPQTLRALRFSSHLIHSPLRADYWSTVPYRLGDHVVKYRVRPVSVPGTAPTALDGPDALSDTLVRELSGGDAVFEVGADVQTDPARQPVEDPTIAWHLNGAEYTRLAELRLPRQTVEPRSKAAEEIALSPWNALEEHRPLGGINRSRLQIYLALQKARHEATGVKPVGTVAAPAED